MFFGWPYTDLHSLNLDWILNQLKMWQAQWEQLPNYIKEQIEQYLSDANLAEIVQNVLQEYGFIINVKAPGNNLTPAVGDGRTDDTAAIQAMIAYGSTHGMPLLFPAGTYRVSGLNVNVDTVFMGSTSTLMLMNVSSAPLISVSAKFECFGMTLNGNIGGQTTPQNVINCTSGRFMINHCHISSGLSGITGNVTGDCRLVNSEISNFSEYGLYLGGSGRIVSTGVDIPNVASGGALRFIRLDVSNSYIDAWESVAEIAVGVEITGNNNYVSVNFPNVETPVNDGGQNNNWEVVGKSEKRYFNGNVYHEYQNLQETVEGDLTQSVGDFDGTASGHYSFSGLDVILNPYNPLTYKTPSVLNSFFDRVEFKDAAGKNYNVLVENDGTSSLSPSHNVANIIDYGAVGDGSTLCDTAFTSALATGLPVYVPSGRFLISETISLGSFQHIIGVGNNNLSSNSNSIIVSNNASTPVITLEYGSQFNSVEGVTVIHSVTATSGGDGVIAQGVSNSTIRNVWSINNYNGFNLGNTGISWFTDCVSMNNTAVGVLYTNLAFSGALQWQTQRIFSSLNISHGFSIVGVANSANHVTLGAFTEVYTYNNGGRGFYILGAENAGINGFRIQNSFFGNDIGGGIEINAAGTFGGFISDTILEAAGVSAESQFENNENAFGIYIIEGSGPVTISNCLIHTSAATGIQNRNQMTIVEGCQIIGNGYLQTNKIGIQQVLGTMIISNSFFNGQDYAGIIITNTENQIITSNMMKETTTPYRALAGEDNIIYQNNTNVT